MKNRTKKYFTNMKKHKNEIRNDRTRKTESFEKVPVNKISLADWIFDAKNQK